MLGAICLSRLGARERRLALGASLAEFPPGVGRLLLRSFSPHLNLRDMSPNPGPTEFHCGDESIGGVSPVSLALRGDEWMLSRVAILAYTRPKHPRVLVTDREL